MLHQLYVNICHCLKLCRGGRNIFCKGQRESGQLIAHLLLERKRIAVSSWPGKVSVGGETSPNNGNQRPLHGVQAVVSSKEIN